jgi:chemotaxis protein CheD
MNTLQRSIEEAGGEVPVYVREWRYLQPGQLFVAKTPTTITTILGSCVAVCLWDAERRVGGLNHFMLPMVAGSAAASPRFGNVAMNELFAKMRDAGARLPFLRARVIGGACMFEAMRSSAHLGRKNADFALDALSKRGIEVVQVEVGGNRGRKLIFNTDEGSACLTSI